MEIGTMKSSSFIGIAMALLLFGGCAWFSHEQEEKPASELIQVGMKAYEKGEYSDAIKNFQQLKDWYPFSKYAIEAELKIADSHYYLDQYAEAIAAYEEYEQLHPRNEAIPYVIYQIGRCYYDQMDTIDRDQTSARKALETFRRLIRQFPEDSYAIKARTHVTICLQSLAGHEFYVAKFYLRSKKYKAALQRFKAVIANYPDVGVQYQALKYIAQCEALVAVAEKKQASNN
jgi:outer membrane protein assembly factor BamD